MHPLLVRLSLGELGLPLLPALLALTFVGLTVVLLAVLARRRALFLAGAALSVAALGFAVRLRGQTLSPGALLVSSFGASCALALGVSWVVVTRGARARGLDVERVGWVLFLTLGAALLGARVAYVVTSPEHGLFDVLALSRGGLSAAGAFLGGLLALGVAAPRAGLRALGVLDLIAPALAFSVISLRLGCLLQGCDYGPALDASAPAALRALGTLERWPDTFELGAGPPALLAQIAQGAVAASATTTAPAHPTPLYEALLGLGLLAGALWLSKRQRFEGQTGLAVLGGYALGAATLSPLFADPERAALSPWLFLGLGLGVGATWLTLFRRSAVGIAAASAVTSAPSGDSSRR